MGMGIKKQKKQKPMQKKKEEQQLNIAGKEIRGIVRIAARDINGIYKIPKALRQIKGIGHTLSIVLSQVIEKELQINQNTLIGELNDEQIQKIEQIIANPMGYGVPKFLLNRQKEYQTNEPKHLIGNDLIFAIKQDIEHEKESQTWRGFRHTYGKKVRGQRTRTTGRKGMTVGVLRKAVKQQQGAASQQQKQAKESKEKEAKK
jgi:small subunit ribosomal protein S13